MEAAQRAGSRKAKCGARQRRREATRRFRLSRRVRLGIPEVERQIQREAETSLHSRMNDITSQCEISQRWSLSWGTANILPRCWHRSSRTSGTANRTSYGGTCAQLPVGLNKGLQGLDRYVGGYTYTANVRPVAAGLLPRGHSPRCVLAVV